MAKLNIAVRTLKEGPDGVLRAYFIDAATGQYVQDTSGYNIIRAHENDDVMSAQGVNIQNYKRALEQTPPEQSVAEEVVDKEVKADPVKAEDFKKEDPATASDTSAMDFQEHGDEDAPSANVDTSGSKRSGLGSLGLFDRSAGNNYGYIDKPGFMGTVGTLAANMVGLGTVARAGNAAIGINNENAANRARESIGLDSRGLGGYARSAFADNGGKVADVTIGDEDYNVGFEAVNRAGQTNLTPNEARNRALRTGQNLTETSRDRAKQNTRDFKDEFGSNKGLLGNAIEQTSSALGGFAKSAGDFINSLFGGSQQAREPSYMGADYFPERPNAPSTRADPWGGLRSVDVSTDANPNGVSIDANGFPSAPRSPTETGINPDDRTTPTSVTTGGGTNPDDRGGISGDQADKASRSDGLY